MPAPAEVQILIDIKARLDELAKVQAGFRSARDEAQGFGDFLAQGLGIGGGMALAQRGIEMFKEAVLDGFSAANRLAKEIQQSAPDIGFTGEQYQVFKTQLSESGVEMGRLTMAVSSQTNSLDAARRGVGQASDAYRDLGLSAAEIDLLPTDERLLAVAKATLTAADQTKAFAAAGDILGKRGLPSLLGALKNLATYGYGAVSKELIDAGRVMDDQTAALLRNNQKQIDALKQWRDVKEGESMGFGTLFARAAWNDPLGLLKSVANRDTDGPTGTAAFLAKYMPAVAPEKPAPSGPANARDEDVLQAGIAGAQSNISNIQANPFQLETEKRAALNEQLTLQIDLYRRIEQLKFSDAITPDKNGETLVSRVETLNDLYRQLMLLDPQADHAPLLAKIAGTQITENDLARYREFVALEAKRRAAEDTRTNALGLGTPASAQIAEQFKGINDPTVNKNFLTSGQGLMAGFQQWATQAGSVGQQIAASLQGTLGSTISDIGTQLTGAITKTQTWGVALGNIWRSFGTSMLQAFIQMVAQYAVSKATMFALDTLFAAKSLALSLSAAASAFLAWLPAAIASSISSYGIAAAIGLAAVLGVVKGFSGGGYTGSGGKYEPAGIVHKGEYVIPAETVSRVGVSALDNLRFAGAAGYASGGMVGGGSGSAAPVFGRPQLHVIHTDDASLVARLKRRPDFEVIVTDIGKRRRGDIFSV